MLHVDKTYGDDSDFDEYTCNVCLSDLAICHCFCQHCGNQREGEIEIKCPVPKCVDIDDRVCIECKSIHDKEHNL